jgi:hypothetical protein
MVLPRWLHRDVGLVVGLEIGRPVGAELPVKLMHIQLAPIVCLVPFPHPVRLCCRWPPPPQNDATNKLRITWTTRKGPVAIVMCMAAPA